MGRLCSLQVHTACCLLVVVDSVEGADVAHSLALALVRAALQQFLCDLTAELLRFLYPACDLDDPLGAHPNPPLKSDGCDSLVERRTGRTACTPRTESMPPATRRALSFSG